MGGAGLEADDAPEHHGRQHHATTPTPPTWCSRLAARPITMVGVNVTTPTILEAPDQARIAASDQPHARFAWRILAFYLDFYERFLGRRAASLHDPLAAGILRDPTLRHRAPWTPRWASCDSEKGARAVAPLAPSAAVACRTGPTRIATDGRWPPLRRGLRGCAHVAPAGPDAGRRIDERAGAGRYRPLTVEEVPDYVRARPELRALAGDGPLTVREVGDGNLNLVFIVRDDPAVPGVVLKQSLPWVRVFGEGWPLTVERARHEADAYAGPQPFAGDATPRYHGFDPAGYVIAMEDLADLRVWRGALNDGEIHAEAAATLGHASWRASRSTPPTWAWTRRSASGGSRATINPGAVPHHRGPRAHRAVHGPRAQPPPPRARARGRRRSAPTRRSLDGLSVLKHRFMTRGEALIHGDLHTGSVMVGGGRTVAIDPEFAFYGPVGFDLGAIWANAVIATVRAVLLDRPADFRAHVEGIVAVIVDGLHGRARGTVAGARRPSSPTACARPGSGDLGTTRSGSRAPRRCGA